MFSACLSPVFNTVTNSWEKAYLAQVVEVNDIDCLCHTLLSFWGTRLDRQNGVDDPNNPLIPQFSLRTRALVICGDVTGNLLLNGTLDESNVILEIEILPGVPNQIVLDTTAPIPNIIDYNFESYMKFNNCNPCCSECDCLDTTVTIVFVAEEMNAKLDSTLSGGLWFIDDVTFA
jgi:hypothetical protein